MDVPWYLDVIYQVACGKGSQQVCSFYFGFVGSHLRFVGALWSFHVCANSHHLANLALMVDCWRLDSKDTRIIALLRCAHPKLHLLVFCLLGTWIAFRVLIIVVFSHIFWGALSTHDRANTSRGRLYEQYQLWLEVVGSSEVVGHKPCLQCFWRWNCSNLLILMLVHNLLDLASVLRGITYANSTQYLKVFILYTSIFNSLILRVNAWLIASLNGSIKFLGMYMFCH